MKVHKSAALVAGAAALALALAACSSSGGGGSNTGAASPTGGGNGTSAASSSSSSSSTSSGAAPSGTIVYGESTEFPNNLQPLIAAGNATSVANLEVRLFNGPERITPNITYEYDPDQVSAAPTSKIVKGQQVVSFSINPKAVWADGQPITPADWIFSWQTLRSSDPKNGGCAQLLSTTGWDQLQSVTAVGKYGVKMTFKKGEDYPDWQSLLVGISEGSPLSKHVFDQGSPAATCAYIAKGWPVKDGIPLGAQNGPWVLNPSDIDATNKVFNLTPNPKYWGAQPKLANLVDHYIGSDPNTNVDALKNGEVNMIYPQPQLDLVSNLQKLSNVTTQINFGTSFEHLDMNTKDPLLAHKQIREAIALAIDRPALVNATVGQFSDKASVLGNRMILSNQPGYQDHSGQYAHQNIAKAKQLLQSIGCTMGSGGIYNCFGKPLSFKVDTTTDNPLRDQTIQIMANQVKAAGIKLTEFANDNIFGGPTDPGSLVSEQFQLALFAWVGGPAISQNQSIYISPLNHHGQQQNYTQGGTSQIDAALKKMSTAPNTTVEKQWANTADKLLWQQMYTLPLYQKPTLLSFSSNYQGIGDNPTQVGPLWNSDTWSKVS